VIFNVETLKLTFYRGESGFWYTVSPLSAMLINR